MHSIAAVVLAVVLPASFPVTFSKHAAATSAFYGAYHISMMWNACSATWFCCTDMIPGCSPLVQRTWAWSHRTTSIGCAALFMVLWPHYQSGDSMLARVAELLRLSHMAVVNLMMYACASEEAPCPQQPPPPPPPFPKEANILKSILEDHPAIASLLSPLSCAVCQDLDHTRPVVSVPCGHIFHETCIVAWFAVDPQGYSCPMCRRHF